MANKRVKGRFITVEGQDGAGKSTNIATVVEALSLKGIQCVKTREPGGTQLGETLRDILLNRKDLAISEMAELLLMFAARAQHIETVIKPALNQGQWVICDRFTDATFAYQGGGRQMDTQVISALEQTVQGELRPDLTILLDLPLELGLSRTDERGARDRFEDENMAFKQRVRQTYLDRQVADPTRIKVVNASLSLSDVKSQVTDLIDYFYQSNAE